jgi:hypothetical protein
MASRSGFSRDYAGEYLIPPESSQPRDNARHDASFNNGPAVVGGLARSREFDYGTPVFGRPMTAAKLRQAFGLKP